MVDIQSDCLLTGLFSPEIRFEFIALFGKHQMVSALFLKIGQCLEKVGFTEMDLICIAIMTGPITSLGT